MVRSVILPGVCCILAACSTLAPDYEITLKDGRKIEVKEWPRLDDATGFYLGEQWDGSLVQFHEGQVASISVKGAQ